MSALLHDWSAITVVLAGLVVTAAWQGIVLALAVALCLRLMPRLGAARRWAILAAAALLVIALHLLPLVGSTDRTSRVVMWHIPGVWSQGFALLWLTLSLLRAVQLTASWIAVTRLVGRAAPCEIGQEITDLLRSGPRPVLLCTSAEVSRPSVAGFLRPRILLPPALLAAFPAYELRQVLLHELEHLRRRDDWTNLLQRLALVLFPLNPALLWLERRLCVERELACDERVLLAAGTRESYALCLTRIAEYSAFGRGAALVLGVLGAGHSELARRVDRILAPPVKTMHRATAGLLAAGLGLGLLGATLEMARSPQLISFQTAMPIAVASQASQLVPAADAAPTARLADSASAFHAVSYAPSPARNRHRGLRRAIFRPRPLLPSRPDPEFAPYSVVRTYAAVRVSGGWLFIQL